MKTLKEIILEKLKINSKSKIYNKNSEDWSILNAEDGDIVELNDNLQK